MKKASVSNKKWRHLNPEKARVHDKVRRAIKSGKLKRQPCEGCGSEKSQAHHDDYSKPLEVRWLCSRCRRDHHTVESGNTIGGKPIVRRPRKPATWPGRKQYQPAPKRDALCDTARTLYAEGQSYGSIARTLGVSKGTVYKWINPHINYR